MTATFYVKYAFTAKDVSYASMDVCEVIVVINVLQFCLVRLFSLYLLLFYYYFSGKSKAVVSYAGWVIICCVLYVHECSDMSDQSLIRWNWGSWDNEMFCLCPSSICAIREVLQLIRRILCPQHSYPISDRTSPIPSTTVQACHILRRFWARSFFQRIFQF